MNTICMYNIPQMLGDFMVFSCFNSLCKYHVWIHIDEWEKEKFEFSFSKGIHWCVNRLIQELTVIWPQEVVEATKEQKEIMVEMTQDPTSLKYWAFPQTT